MYHILYLLARLLARFGRNNERGQQECPNANRNPARGDYSIKHQEQKRPKRLKQPKAKTMYALHDVGLSDVDASIKIRS